MKTTPTELLIDASQLHAWYGSSHVLHGIDFQLRRGETVGLLGRNGMGKSTLIRSLLGHVRERQGSITVQGRDVSKGKPFEAARLGIAYVPEGRGIFPTLTVRENLVMAARASENGEWNWTYERILDIFPRLGSRLQNLGWQLSGGEQQMLSIGRALMTNPSAIILDEATEGLAPLIVAEIWKVIAEIRHSGLATLVVDRNYHTVMNNADRLIVLAKGKQVLGGSTPELRAQPEALARHLGV